MGPSPTKACGRPPLRSARSEPIGATGVPAAAEQPEASIQVALPPWRAETAASLPSWVWIVLLFSAAVAVGLLLQMLDFSLLRRLLSWRQAEGVRAMVEAIRQPARLILPSWSCSPCCLSAACARPARRR